MRSWRCLIKRSSKGGVLVEFALSGLLLVATLLATIDFGVEIYARTTTDRLTNRAAEVYASTRDMDAVMEVLEGRADRLVQRCVEVPDPVLFDSVVGINPLLDAGRSAPEGRDDSSAMAFRMEITCTWPRLTPLVGPIMGSSDGYTAQAFLRFRTEGGL